MIRFLTVAVIAVVTLFAMAVDAEQPNIVIILADDMGYSDLACYGNQFHDTPVIDQLAATGIRFTDFYAATPVCSSTRSTIMTGQYSARTGITDFIPGHWRPFEKLIVPPVNAHLDDSVATLGDVFRAAGYRTGYFGKWHLGGTDHQPQDHGFDVVDGGPEFRKRWGQQPRGPKQIEFLTAAATDFIRRNETRPFFLFLSHYAVHIPVEGHPATVAKYRERAQNTSSGGVNHPVYAAMVQDLDTSVGTLLKQLDSSQLADNTIVVFLSDNGGLHKIFTGVGETIATNHPLRSEKGTLYEGGIRVPMIVRWPSGGFRSQTVDVPSTTADLLPTLCDMAEVDLPDQPIDGTSLHSWMASQSKPDDWKRQSIFFHYPHYHHSRPAGAIRSGNWKLIEFFDDGSLELYDLDSDVAESTNQAGQQPELARRLRQKLVEWRGDRRSNAGA